MKVERKRNVELSSQQVNCGLESAEWILVITFSDLLLVLAISNGKPLGVAGSGYCHVDLFGSWM